MNLKKSLLIAPAIIGAVAFGSKTALADEISTQSLNNIETKTVYYSGNASAKMDENSQDSLVSNKHYQSQEDSNTGVSATILSDENDSTTKELLSEKALTEVNSSEKLTEADKAKIAKEKEEKAVIPIEELLPKKINLIPLNGRPIYPGIFTPLLINDADGCPSYINENGGTLPRAKVVFIHVSTSGSRRPTLTLTCAKASVVGSKKSPTTHKS
mgnify:CR=1 FL=1